MKLSPFLALLSLYATPLVDSSFVHVVGFQEPLPNMNVVPDKDTILALAGLKSHNELSLQLASNSEQELFSKNPLSFVVFVNSLTPESNKFSLKPTWELENSNEIEDEIKTIAKASIESKPQNGDNCNIRNILLKDGEEKFTCLKKKPDFQSFMKKEDYKVWEGLLEESLLLKQIVNEVIEESMQTNQPFFVPFTFEGLAPILASFGAKSEQYERSLELLSKSLEETISVLKSNMLFSTRFTFQVIANTVGKRSFVKRDTPTVVYPPPSTFISHCYLSADDCNNKTASCSSRGTCQKFTVQNNNPCYACVCGVSNNTQWGGNACEFDDITSDFHLLFWTSIGLIFVVGFTSFFMVQHGGSSQNDSQSGNGGSDHSKSD